MLPWQPGAGTFHDVEMIFVTVHWQAAVSSSCYYLVLFPQLPQPLFPRQPSTINTSTATMADPVLMVVSIVEALGSTASCCCQIIMRAADAPKEIMDLNAEACNWRPQLQVS